MMYVAFRDPGIINPNAESLKTVRSPSSVNDSVYEEDDEVLRDSRIYTSR